MSLSPSETPDVASSDRSLVLAVLTYRRTSDLPELLPQLLEQGGTVAHRTSVLVVDNDAAASARETVEELALPGVRYVVEPTPGIAAARNRVLDETRDADLLVFIDDDERPEPGWLSALVACQEAEGCAAVAGAVVPQVDAIEDPWIHAGGFFVRGRQTTGTEMRAASTANLLLDLRQVRSLGDVRFDPQFGLSGGSDTLFTLTLSRNGGRIVWCDEAVVTDYIRSARLTRAWVLRRQFRIGNSWSRTGLELESGPVGRLGARARLTARGLARLVVGFLRSSWGSLTRSLRHQALGSKMTARGMGMVLGAWGAVYVDYKRERTSKPR